MATIAAFFLLLLLVVLFITIEVALIVYIRSNMKYCIYEHEDQKIYKCENSNTTSKEDFDYLDCEAPRYHGTRSHLPPQSIQLS